MQSHTLVILRELNLSATLLNLALNDAAVATHKRLKRPGRGDEGPTQSLEMRTESRVRPR